MKKTDRTCTNNCSDVCGECQIMVFNDTMKKTIEEVAEEYSRKVLERYEEKELNLDEKIYLSGASSVGYLAGAKYQSEQMYSEEDMNQYAKWIYEDDGSLIDNNGHPKKESLQLWKKWKESKS